MAIQAYGGDLIANPHVGPAKFQNDAAIGMGLIIGNKLDIRPPPRWGINE